MRLVFVNHAHPAVRHVAGTRLAAFAQELAARGHQTVLLTCTLDRDSACKTPAEIGLQLRSLKPGSFIHVACPPRSDRHRPALRLARRIAPVRRSLTLASMIFEGGTFGDWVRGTAPYWPAFAEFRPHAIVGTFGNTTNLALAQKVARVTGAVWVADIKDNWDAFVPAGLRHYMAWRFRDAAAVTANSVLHADIVAKYVRAAPTVIYSGVPDTLMQTFAVECDLFRIAVIGSARSEEALVTFLQAAERWRKRRGPDDAARVELFYAGPDDPSFRRAASQAKWQGALDIRGYLPLQQLARECKAAAVNCYMWAPWTFHHKLVELIAFGRPIISFPGEHEESIEIARTHRANLSACANPNSIDCALESAWHDWAKGTFPGSPSLQDLNWASAAARLERLLDRIVGPN